MKINNINELLLLLFLLLFACNKSKTDNVPEPEVDFYFKGVVYNKFSHSPIPRIKVTIFKLQYSST